MCRQNGGSALQYKQEQGKGDGTVTVTLYSGEWHAVIQTDCGADLVRVQHKGRDVLAPSHKDGTFSFLHGSPMLFPANRTCGGAFRFGGREWKLGVNEPSTGAHLHGTLCVQPFEMVHADAQTVRLSYDNRREVYPFPFRMTVEYGVRENDFYQQYTLTNTGDTPLPYTFGLHTTFANVRHMAVPLKACQERDALAIPTGCYMPLDAVQAQYVAGIDPSSLAVSGYYAASGHTAVVGNYRYTVSENFDHWVLYNGGGNTGFLCVEPQCGAVNGLNIPDGHHVLQPQQQVVFETRITPL